MSLLLRACNRKPSKEMLRNKTVYRLHVAGGVGINELSCMPERGVWTGIATPCPERQWPLMKATDEGKNTQMIRLHHRAVIYLQLSFEGDCFNCGSNPRAAEKHFKTPK